MTRRFSVKKEKRKIFFYFFDYSLTEAAHAEVDPCAVLAQTRRLMLDCDVLVHVIIVRNDVTARLARWTGKQVLKYFKTAKHM